MFSAGVLSNTLNIVIKTMAVVYSKPKNEGMHKRQQNYKTLWLFSYK
ncbi:hypothetical protein M23134_06015 [Microscilla marina ATCC 23134]|uniref:Uncharacterized protein n=1 Tax=Microscilla marina ATCC 23134 TaxID=313606 RepID=A1ZU29_MICM2|nr:hypothetical protein M23134_06015 [Microscilla marina ATCC 23134]